MNISKTLFAVMLLFGMMSCVSSDRYGIKSADKIQINIQRFDKDLIGFDKQNVQTGITALYKNYREFMPVFVAEVMDENPTDTAKIGSLILEFLNDTNFTEVNKLEIAKFNDVSAIENEISYAFSGIHKLFPKIKIPEIYFFVSGFNRAILSNDDFIALGTDLYLGNDYPKYTEFTYQYLTVNMRPESVPVDVVADLLYRNFQMPPSDDRLLENMIHHGKILYLLSVLLPDRKPDQIIGYTTQQIDWCLKYEKDIWSTIIEQKHLFSTDMQLINKYINDAPFTSPVSQESPGRLATWIGWQIIDSYMNKNEKLSLAELMAEKNAQKILENSGYRP